MFCYLRILGLGGGTRFHQVLSHILEGRNGSLEILTILGSPSALLERLPAPAIHFVRNLLSSSGYTLAAFCIRRRGLWPTVVLNHYGTPSLWHLSFSQVRLMIAS